MKATYNLDNYLPHPTVYCTHLCIGHAVNWNIIHLFSGYFNSDGTFTILKNDSIKAKQLSNDEWVYADKNKDELWIF